MSDQQEGLTDAAEHVARPSTSTTDLAFREDLAFPRLDRSAMERLGCYGQEVSVAEDTCLYSYGDRDTDMLVVLSGEVESRLLVEGGGSKVFRILHPGDFSGEFNLLNSQKSVAEARTTMPSRLLRISRKNLRLLMRAEGDLANIIVSACIWRRIGINADSTTGVVLRGRENDPEFVELRRFMVRNLYPHRIVEVPPDAEPDTEPGSETGQVKLPAVELLDGRVLVRPTIPNVADALGVNESPSTHMIYDVAVVGAGPAGLAAAVYAASEGLSTIVIEGIAPGGQAGTSSKIENYLGFPTGISGAQLASRGHLQALKFGVDFAISRNVVTTASFDGIHHLTLLGDTTVRARSVIVASGARYRRLEVKNHAHFENRGIYYAATAMESLLCRDSEIIVVGGGNSAGQASIFLSASARHVHHLIRGDALESTMSKYLIHRIERSSQITLHKNTEIVGLEGETRLEYVTWLNRRTGESLKTRIRNAFVMIGAEPNSGWLYGTVMLDSKGFILTGGNNGFEATAYATDAPGIYAVGDVRAGSVKRVASAVGEGSVVISDVHRYLARNRIDYPKQVQSD